jgi:hypothetical protein
MVLHVVEESDHGFPICTGEVEVTLDSDETAWIEPCQRLVMTEEVIQSIADKLRPLGIKWMRGWRDGHYVGRVIVEHSAIGVSKHEEKG